MSNSRNTKKKVWALKYLAQRHSSERSGASIETRNCGLQIMSLTLHHKPKQH